MLTDHWWIGGTILLAYFHYCNKNVAPFSEDCRDQDLRQLAQLDEQAIQFVHWTRSQVMAHSKRGFFVFSRCGGAIQPLH